MAKIVINTCFGGFGLSDEAIKRYVNETDDLPINYWDIPRDDPILLKIVEEMGEDSYGKWSELKIIEIPDDIEWEIEEYDGKEWVSEKHRTWY